MGLPAVLSANLACTFGAAPSTLVVLPVKKVLMEGKPAATIMDNVPLVNIMPFVMCMSLANPTVAAATAAAFGALTPMPCLPVIVAPWAPGSPTVMVGGVPALNNASMCQCNWGGTISIVNPGTTTEMIP